MLEIIKGIGTKVVTILISTMVAITLLYVAVKYIQGVERDKVESKVVIEALEDYIDTTEGINDAVQDFNRGNPDSNAALEWLRNRQVTGQ